MLVSFAANFLVQWEIYNPTSQLFMRDRKITLVINAVKHLVKLEI